MIPRRALVAGGLVAAAGGAAYLLSDRAPEGVEVDEAPRIEWVAGSESGDGSRPADGLAIRDPLRVATPAPSAPLRARRPGASADFAHELESSLRPAVAATPELPAAFAAPASPDFGGSDDAPKLSVNVAPLEDPRRPRMVAASARIAAGSLEQGQPTLDEGQSPASRDVAIGRHRIEDGDTLESIAKRHYGDASLAGFLFERNQRILKYPDLLPVGKEIVLYEPPAQDASASGEPLPELVPIE